MIKFITPEDTLILRSENLRHDKQPEDCRFSGDDDPESFHLGYYEDDQLVCIASFHSTKYNDQADPGMIVLPGEKAYRLRGMCTSPEYRQKGLGSKLINFAIIYMRGKKVNYLWCHARKVAYSFYLGIGFEFISDELYIEDIGIHKSMYLKIQ